MDDSLSDENGTGNAKRRRISDAAVENQEVPNMIKDDNSSDETTTSSLKMDSNVIYETMKVNRDAGEESILSNWL